MELIKSIQVDGFLFSRYAVISMTLTFQNQTPFPARCLYRFRLPERAEISSLKIVSDAHVFCAKTISIQQAEKLRIDGSQILLQRTGEQTYSLLTQGFSPKNTFQIILDFFSPLTKCGDHHQLTLPLGGGKDNEQSDFPAPPANICLSMLGGNYRILRSPSHPELIRDSTDTIEFSLPADRDFVLDFIQEQKENIAYIGGNLLEKTGLFFFTLPNIGNPQTSHPILFLLDLSALGDVLCAQAKNIVYLTARALGENADFAVMATGENIVFRSFETIHDGGGQALDFAVFLKNQQGGHGNSQELLQRFHAYQKQFDVQGIYITAKDLPEGTLRDIPDSITDSALHFLTFGDKADFPNLTCWAAHHGAYITHLYPQDNMMTSIRQFVQSLKKPKLHKLHIEPLDRQITLFPSAIPVAEAGQTICCAASFTGAHPMTFAVRCTEGETILHLHTVENYDSFRFAEIFYAHQAAKQIEALMQNASPSSWKKLKQKLAHIGIHYNCLNTETALALETPDGIPHALSVSSAVYRRMPVIKTGIGIFGERRMVPANEDRLLLHNGIHYLLACTHGDGSISSFGQTNPQIRAEETLLSAVVLSVLLPDKKQLFPVFKAALEFLQTHPLAIPIYIQAKKALETQNSQKAISLLQTTLPDRNTLLKDTEKNPSVYTVASLLLRIQKPGGYYETNI